MAKGKQDTGIVGPLGGRDAVLTYLFRGYHHGKPFHMSIKSAATGDHFTYRLRPLTFTRPDASGAASFFVDVKTGPEPEDCTWAGLLRWQGARKPLVVEQGDVSSLLPVALKQPLVLLHGARCAHTIGETEHAPRVGSDAASVRGLLWLLKRLNAGVDPAPQAEVWHDGRCCVCRRPLTRPDSVAVGIGPDCLERLMQRGGAL